MYVPKCFQTNITKEELIKKMKNKETLEQSVENKCVAGCKHYYGGEIKHHKDCVYYPESFSKMYDDLKWQQEQDKKLYSEEEVEILLETLSKVLVYQGNYYRLPYYFEHEIEQVIEQFKNKTI
jgi:hypothetical protein